MEAYTSTLTYSLTHSLISPPNARVSHLKLLYLNQDETMQLQCIPVREDCYRRGTD